MIDVLLKRVRDRRDLNAKNAEMHDDELVRIVAEGRVGAYSNVEQDAKELAKHAQSILSVIRVV